jgi:hypothetical protein
MFSLHHYEYLRNLVAIEEDVIGEHLGDRLEFDMGDL